jgi:ubiquinol oxidase
VLPGMCASAGFSAQALQPGEHGRNPSASRSAGSVDRFALAATRSLRGLADQFFAKRYGHRAVVLETVAAVPGMAGAMATHLQSLRRMVDDDGWIRTLMEKAENERMHLMTFVRIARPTALERLLILPAQWIFYVGFLGLYLVSRRTAHRLVDYFEEEAVPSYTADLAKSTPAMPPMSRRPRLPGGTGICRPL